MCEALRELMKDEIEKDIREREEQQFERGIAKGTLETLKGLARDGLLELKVAAERANMSVESFTAELNKAGAK